MTPITVENTCVVDGRMNEKEAQKAVREADVVWLSGGDPALEFGYFEKYRINEEIRAHEGVIIGMSAGSMNLSRKVVYVEPKGSSEPLIYDALGCTDLIIDPHFDIANVHEKLLSLSYSYTFYGLCDESVIIIDGDDTLLIGDVYLISNGKIKKIS